MSQKIKNREQLFFEIAHLLARCQTPEEQHIVLTKILHQLEIAKSNFEPLNSMNNEKNEVQRQLVRYYQLGFIRWALQQKKLITDQFVLIAGKLLWYNEKSKRQEYFDIPHNLRLAFNEGWESFRKIPQTA